MFNFDDIIEESYDAEYDNDHYTEDYDAYDLNSYCDAVLENKSNIKVSDSAKRFADRMSGNHQVGKTIHDDIYNYGGIYTKGMKTTKDFKDRNRINNKNAKALTKTDKYLDKKRDKNIKRASKGKEIKKDITDPRHIKIESSIYDEVNDLFDFETV